MLGVAALAYAFPGFLLHWAGQGSSLSKRESTEIAAAALTSLFVERERADLLLLWWGPVAGAPVFGDRAVRALVEPYRGSQTRVSRARPFALAIIDSAALRLPVRWQPVTLATMEAHFRENAAGWDSWFRRYPGNSGVVEIAAPVPRAGGKEAVVLVGRSCGDHCRTAWRLVMRQGFGGWVVDSVTPLALPRS